MDKQGQGDSTGERQHATLRAGTASLTATACCCARFNHGGRAGEDAR
ncbi:MULTISPECIES: DUF6380 family protein [unclassified Streptomyces]